MGTPILGTNVSSAVVPFTTDDAYPTHDAQYGKGGWREVADLTALAAVPVVRLRSGAAAWVVSAQLVYIFDGAAWAPYAPIDTTAKRKALARVFFGF